MWIPITGRQIEDFEILSSGSVTGWGGWRSQQGWRPLWSRLYSLLSASVGGRYTCSLRLQRVCGFFVMPFWQARHPGVWFWRSIAGCLSIPAFTILCPGNSKPRFFSSRTLARGFLIRYCFSSILGRENPSLAILPKFKARRMSDCSSCTRHPCLAIVADMLNNHKKLVVASHNEMWLLPQPYTLP